jgi:hypothetical protein
MDGLLVRNSCRICGVPARNGRFSASKADFGCRVMAYPWDPLGPENATWGNVARLWPVGAGHAVVAIDSASSTDSGTKGTGECHSPVPVNHTSFLDHQNNAHGPGHDDLHRQM